MKTTVAALGILMLQSCTGMSFAEMERKSMNCEPRDSEECKEVIDRFERMLRNRERRKQFECPPGMVVFTDHNGSSCISRERLERWLDGIPY